MKRYRSTNFFIDCIRNIPDQQEIRRFVVSRYGESDIENKYKRFMSFKPPSLRVIIEYHDLLQEIEDSYVYGLFYPSLTSACCLGERIFNILILKLRDYYKTSGHYKSIYQKQSFDDWEKAIGILCDWGVIQSDDIKTKYKELREIRHSAIHFKKLEDIENKAIKALKIIFDIIAYFFAIGSREDIYFWCPGEIYIRKEAEKSPFVKEMILPHCYLVGYKHRMEGTGERLILKDENMYDEKNLTDGEFIILRKSAR